jgi:hypothetical protein
MSRPTAIEQAAIDVVSRVDPGSGFGEKTAKLREMLEAKYPGSLARAKARRVKERFEQKFEGSPPAWAKRYIAKHGQGYVRRLIWRRSRVKTYSSGRCWIYDGRIVVTAGLGGEEEHRVVLLHEIAHAKTVETHTTRFYEALHEMLVAEGLYRAGLKREHPRSLKAAASRARRRA